MLKSIWAVALISVAAGLFAQDMEVCLDSKKWHSGHNSPACLMEDAVVSIGGMERKALKITFQKIGSMKNPEARLTFQPVVDISKFSSLEFKVMVGPSSIGSGWVALRDSAWKQKMAGLTRIYGQGKIPAGDWIDMSMKISPDLPLDASKLIQLAIGFPTDALPDGDRVEIILADCFFRAKAPAPASDLASAWSHKVGGYSPDYSDSSWMLGPPREGRIASPLKLAEAGEARCEIIRAKDADGVTETAAGELRDWLEKITGAKIPLLQEPGPDKNTKIFLGREWADKHAGDIKALEGSDGYAVRSSGNNIHIFGAVPKGTMNGVFAFLENNTDIIWPRPKPEIGAVFSVSPSLSAVWGDSLSRPKSRLRGWGTNYGFNKNDEIWMSRNLCNFPAGGGGFDRTGGVCSFRSRWGNYVEYGGGHNLIMYLPPEKYFKNHPEFYPLINGKRQFLKAMEHQICFTNQEMTRVFIANALEELEKAPRMIDCLNIKIEDNWGLCECPECVRPIRLPDGTELKVGDPKFRSTQFFIFLNQVASEIYKRHPKVQITTYGYFFTAVAPRIDVFHTIRVYYCPYVRTNDKFPLFADENSMWRDRTKEWAAACGRVVSREYYGVGTLFPRPLSEVAAADLGWLVSLGVVEFTSEIQPDFSREWGGKMVNNEWAWDASMMDYWVITRLYWDPSADVESLRKYFLRRTFREGAPHMEKYFGLLRKAWYADPLVSTCGDNPVPLTKHYILGKGFEDEMRMCLREAERSCDHPVSKQLAARHRERFESWVADAKASKTPEAAVPLIDNASESFGDFDSPMWSKAAVLNGFKKMGKPEKSANDTEVRLAHDAKSLLIKMVFRDAEPSKAHAVARTQPGEAWTSGDHGEIFLGEQEKPGAYFQLAFDCLGNKYDGSAEMQGRWDGQWDCKVRRTASAWEAVLSVPLEQIKFNLGKGSRLKALFYREFNHNNNKAREDSSWGGGVVHQSADFGELTLMR